MHSRKVFALSLFAVLQPVLGQYHLTKDYFQPSFFDNFDFFNGPDPTHGFVEYQGRIDSLIRSSPSNAQMHVSTEQVTPGGRPSIRITSKESYESGLIILDLAHMPGSICGAWPAFWMYGPDWPNNGEIDIIEGVNDATTNEMTLHTGQSCSLSPSNMLGQVSTNDCDLSTGGATGCGIKTTNTMSYGTGFNKNGGGVYATLLGSNSIQMWFWPRQSVPSDVLSGSPDPTTWSTPVANFTGACDFATSFNQQQIVFDTTFCGDWAGTVWPQSSCSQLASTCNDYVQNNGAAFKEAYWSINSLKVFQRGKRRHSTSRSRPEATPLPTSQLTSSATTSPLIPSLSPTSSTTISIPSASQLPSTTTSIPSASQLPSTTTSIPSASQLPSTIPVETTPLTPSIVPSLSFSSVPSTSPTPSASQLPSAIPPAASTPAATTTADPPPPAASSPVFASSIPTTFITKTRTKKHRTKTLSETDAVTPVPTAPISETTTTTTTTARGKKAQATETVTYGVWSVVPWSHHGRPAEHTTWAINEIVM